MATRRISLPVYDYVVPRVNPAWWRKMGFSIHITSKLTDEYIEHRRLTAVLSHAKTTASGTIEFVSHDGLCNHMRYNEIIPGELLGEGAYSSVYKASYKSVNYAGKIYRKIDTAALKYITSKEIVTRDIIIEMIVHACVSRLLDPSEVPRLIRVGYCLKRKQPFILMETLTGGKFLGELLKSHSYTCAQKSQIVMETMDKTRCILEKLQKAIKFVHSDLHPDNVYVRLGPDKHVKSVAILDFGLSSMELSSRSKRIGSKCAFVPEFNPCVDLEFLAYSTLKIYRDYLTTKVCDTLNEMSKKILDDPELEDCETWGPALIALHEIWCDTNDNDSYGIP